jgi:hypothetical protein
MQPMSQAPSWPFIEGGQMARIPLRSSIQVGVLCQGEVKEMSDREKTAWAIVISLFFIAEFWLIYLK